MILMGKLEGKGQLERSRRRWDGNIKMKLNKIGGMKWIHLAQDRDQWGTLVNTMINLRDL
jgi:hypothetical protein